MGPYTHGKRTRKRHHVPKDIVPFENRDSYSLTSEVKVQLPSEVKEKFTSEVKEKFTSEVKDKLKNIHV